jgi:type I restriction enzyme M protein
MKAKLPSRPGGGDRSRWRAEGVVSLPSRVFRPPAKGEHEKNNLPYCLARWRQRKDSERERARTKELVHEEVEHRPPLEILAELRTIEQEILQGIEELEGMLR